jgi:hypothetical protein
MFSGEESRFAAMSLIARKDLAMLQIVLTYRFQFQASQLKAESRVFG